MPKPASLPEWASNGTLILEPGAGFKASGWANATRPPAKYQNWYQELVYRWCEYLDGIEGEGLTWTVLQNFAAVTASGLVTASAGITTTTLTASGLITANAGVSATTVTATTHVQATDGADAYARLTTASNAGRLTFTEDEATYSATVKIPAGWNAAATANAVMDIPPEAVVTSIEGGSGVVSPGAEVAIVSQGSFTPTITAGSKNYVHQVGTWCRIGSMVTVEFDVQYNTGSGITTVAIGGLPYSRASTWRGITAPTDPGPCGQVFDTTNLILYHGQMSGSTVLVLDGTGASPGGGIAGHFSGQATYFTGP